MGGANKALLDLGGQPLLARTLQALDGLAAETILLVNDPLTVAVAPSARVVRDPSPHAGVLAALEAGLRAARGDVCLTVACDMPFASPAVFRGLLERLLQTGADVAIAWAANHLQPMHAAYRRDPVLRAVSDARARGEYRLIGTLQRLPIDKVPPAEWERWDPSGRAFTNVNTPADLVEVRRLLGG